MATFRWTLALLVSWCFCVEIISSLQFGPFTIPTLTNGGSFGFSNSLINASVEPFKRRAAFEVQTPQLGIFGVSQQVPLTNLIGRFVPSDSNNNAVSTNRQLPAASNLINSFLRQIGGDVSTNRLENVANSIHDIASNASQIVLNPFGALNQFVRRNLQRPNPDSSLSNDNEILPPWSPPSDASSTQPVISNVIDTRDFTVNRKDPHYFPGRQVMVHLFEWKFDDIAEECETVLGPAGYGGVQVSPVNEYVVAPDRPWWERYQPISYKIFSRSGNERQFAAMVQRCQAAGIRIYVDLVANHMAAVGTSVPLLGTAGSSSDPRNRLYPAVPYNRSHFHPDCTIGNYQNATEVRDCALNGLPDLDQSVPYVRDRIVNFMNRLIELGVAGFRMDASKHMWPADLDAIYQRLNRLNPAFGFSTDTSPFIYQEVIDLGNEPITASQYTDLGEVTEFKYSYIIGLIFHGTVEARVLQALTSAYATQYGMIPSQSALVFVDNHDNQRGHGAGGDSILTFKDGLKYIQAIAFTLATDYGTVRLMSSYNFTDPNQGPPTDTMQNIQSPTFTSRSCGNGWICEHRWPVIRRMVAFRNFVAPAPLTNEQATSGTFAFCRGQIGFAVFNAGSVTVDGIFQTCLPPGDYCDVITGERRDTQCFGTRVLVYDDGTVSLTLPASSSIVLDLLNRVS